MWSGNNAMVRSKRRDSMFEGRYCNYELDYRSLEDIEHVKHASYKLGCKLPNEKVSNWNNLSSEVVIVTPARVKEGSEESVINDQAYQPC
jgi:hypothetical protein